MDASGKLKVTLTLNEAQIKEAIADWLSARGFDASTGFISIFRTLGDRPGEMDYYTANATNVLIAQPVAHPATRPEDQP